MLAPGSRIEKLKMKTLNTILVLTLGILSTSEVWSAETVCFESIKGRTEIVQSQNEEGAPNVECSDTTGAVLWWGDPFTGTTPMGEMNVDADYSNAEAVVRPREEKVLLLPLCSINCHEGTFPPPPADKNPRELWMHTEIVSSLQLQHGRGGMWCLDCHHPTQRNKLIDNFGNQISLNQPQKLCGKCHGPIFRDWRDGIHGKRIGEWASDGKKRWFVCTECHDPHDIQQGTRNSGFAQIQPELAPKLPKGMTEATH